jgi:nucleoside-diphosphate-sugar epimerase
VLSVEDAAEAHLAAARAKDARYCVGGHNVRFDELIERAAARYGVPLDAPRIGIEEARERATRAEREAEPKRERVLFPRELVDLVATGKPVSSERAERQLGLRWTSLDATLDATRDWMIRLGAGRRPASVDEGREHAR